MLRCAKRVACKMSVYRFRCWCCAFFLLTRLFVFLPVVFTKRLGYNYVSIYAKRFVLLCVAIINAVLIGVNKNNSYICSIIIVATGRCF